MSEPRFTPVPQGASLNDALRGDAIEVQPDESAIPLCRALLAALNRLAAEVEELRAQIGRLG